MSEEPSVLSKLAAQLKAECTGFARIALLGQNITEPTLSGCTTISAASQAAQICSTH